MPLTSRNVNLVLMGGTALLTLALLTSQLIGREDRLSVAATAFAALVLTGLFLAYWRGWDAARYGVVVISTLATGLALPEPFVSQQQTYAVLVAPVLALILTNPGWVLGSVVTIVVCLALRAGGTGIYAELPTLILVAMFAGGIILSRLVTDAAQHAAEANAARAEEALRRAEAQAKELALKAAELTRQNEEQRRLLDLVATLETPAVALADGVLLAPVIGHLDTRRAAGLTDRLLRDVNASRASHVVIDIAGVPTVDTAVAQALLRAVQAVRLLGCDVTITGISASIAATMTHLGVSLAGVRTARTPQEALAQVLGAAPTTMNRVRRN